EKSDTKKRKRQCTTTLPSLEWLRNLAKNPIHPHIEPLPLINKWKYHRNEAPWKQILLTREALRQKIETPQLSALQKKHKMHPSMYDDGYLSNNERPRCSQRILAAAKDHPPFKGSDHPSPESSSSGSGDYDESSDDKKAYDSSFWFLHHRRKRSHIGPLHQVDLPEYCGVNYSSDPKLLGTRVWPLDKAEPNRGLIERDPIGKGRLESCGCEFPGCPDCARFHIREKRIRTMLELRSAFYAWKMDDMGEYVAFSWTKGEEKKFHDTVETMPPDNNFWDELFKRFPEKGRASLVRYYFNVFLLRRRSQQNRNSSSNIYSDDEESELGPVANRFGHGVGNSSESIFCSPNKPH
ncbi:hypothetical protein M569_05324, partial [Genlisea aurea]